LLSSFSTIIDSNSVGGVLPRTSNPAGAFLMGRSPVLRFVFLGVGSPDRYLVQHP
jgi:hypothetical protein